MKTVMILGANASEVPVIKRAREMGHNVIAVDRECDAPGFQVEGVIRVQDSIADKEKILEIAKKYNINGILASVDAGVRSAAYVSQIMKLPGISEKAAFMGTDKVAMRECLKERKIPVPRFYIIKGKNEYLKAIDKFEQRCVVKAADSSGSLGIYLLNNVDMMEEVNYAFDYCKQFSGTGKLLIEEFMEGPEICVESLCSGGFAIQFKLRTKWLKNLHFSRTVDIVNHPSWTKKYKKKLRKLQLKLIWLLKIIRVHHVRR